MTLSDLGNVGELIGAIAVVLSLLYLSVQIRQNTRQVRAATFQGVARGWKEFLYTITSDDRAQLWLKGTVDFTALDAEERSRYFLLFRAYFRGYENDYYQFKQGTFDATPWEGYLNALRDDALSRPGIRRMWEQDRGNFNPEFVEFIDRELKATAVDEAAGSFEPDRKPAPDEEPAL
ncbi:MAG: hypothetical protein JRH19_02640 [Deltaproteobacteria bacterium]|nr:hypothetical protein [Deltaproteobacteria bacterium]